MSFFFQPENWELCYIDIRNWELCYTDIRNFSPVTLPRCSFMDRNQVAGHANTQNYEKYGGTCTAVVWQETQIQRVTRAWEFDRKIWMWKYCVLMLLHYLICRWKQMWTEAIQLQTSAIKKTCKFRIFVTATIINTLITRQYHPTRWPR